MRGRYHLVVGCAMGAAACAAAVGAAAGPASPVADAARGAVAYMTEGCPLPVGAAALAVGTLLPDIDSASSTLGRRMPVSLSFLGHRTWTHTLWALALLLTLSEAVRPLAWCALGYATHLALDSLSSRGVCWLYPAGGYRTFRGGAVVKRGRRAPSLYRVGTFSETAVAAAAIAASAAVVALSMGAA